MFISPFERSFRHHIPSEMCIRYLKIRAWVSKIHPIENYGCDYLSMSSNQLNHFNKTGTRCLAQSTPVTLSWSMQIFQQGFNAYKGYTVYYILNDFTFNMILDGSSTFFHATLWYALTYLTTGINVTSPEILKSIWFVYHVISNGMRYWEYS